MDAWDKDLSNSHRIKYLTPYAEASEMTAEMKVEFRARLEKPGNMGFIALGRPAQAAAYKELAACGISGLVPSGLPKDWEWGVTQRFKYKGQTKIITSMPNPGSTARGTPAMQMCYADLCYYAFSMYNIRLWSVGCEEGQFDGDRDQLVM